MADSTGSNKAEDSLPEKEELFSWDELVDIDREIEKNAEALLGGQDDMVCSYPEGYKYRQPLYSCLTCAAQTGEKAGVCYACSLNCHDGHDLVELYTKRKFCCDCGNSKFKEKCKLFEEKLQVNARNAYNHNFDRLYCTCNELYPPPIEEISEEIEDMHQCVMCEDWFHLSHLYTESEEKEALARILEHGIDNASDFVCKGCVTKMPFLLYYKNFAIDTSPLDLTNEIANSSIEVVGNTETSSTECKIDKFKLSDEKARKTSNIYFEGVIWRNELCKCSSCMMLYEDLECTFLLDPEDTMEFYDEKRRENMALKGETSLKVDEDVNVANKIYDIVVKKTNNRDAALHAYLAVDEMSKHVSDYFKNLDRSKVVTKEDVEKCFEELRAKRPRLESPEEDSAWTQ